VTIASSPGYGESMPRIRYTKRRGSVKNRQPRASVLAGEEEEEEEEEGARADKVGRRERWVG
jgi:hypothetical protein